jgi:hypothetical protein
VPVDLDVVEQFVGLDHGLAVVSVSRPDGRVASSVVNAGVVTHPVTGRRVVGFVIGGTARKVSHLRRNPFASLIWRAGWRWIGVAGPVQLAGPDDTLVGLQPGSVPTLLRAVFVGAGGTHDDWDTYDRVMAEERRVAALVEPAHIYGFAEA